MKLTAKIPCTRLLPCKSSQQVTISALLLLLLPGSPGMHAFSHHMSRLRYTSMSHDDVSKIEA